MTRLRLFILLAVALIATAACNKTRGGKTYSAETVILDRPIVVTNEWLPLEFPNPLHSTANLPQALRISVSSPYEMNTKGVLGLRLSDGTVVCPEVQIKSDRGEWISLADRAFAGRDLELSDRALSGKGNTYVGMRVRSERAITVSRMAWETYDPSKPVGKTEDLVQGAIVLGAILGLALLYGYSPAIWRKIRYLDSSNWPLVQATVEKVLARPHMAGVNGVVTYRTEITYSYQVNGTYYSGIYVVDLESWEFEANWLQENYPKGTMMRAHVNPTKPEESVLI